MDLGQPNAIYACSLIVLALVTWWMVRLRVSPFGMVLRGARQNARRVNAIGLPARQYLLSAYVLSAILCGIAGLLLANLNAFASPSTLSWIVSGDLIVMVVLGGIGSVYGAFLGAFAFLGLEEALKLLTEHWMAVFGLTIVLVERCLARPALSASWKTSKPGSHRSEPAIRRPETPGLVRERWGRTAMNDSLLRTESLVKRYGGLLATDNVSLDIKAGELHAIIGPNGSGKTTLIVMEKGKVVWGGNSDALRNEQDIIHQYLGG